MKKRILCLILVILTILSSICVNVSANTSINYLSDASAKHFLRTISGDFDYVPQESDAYFRLLTGKYSGTSEEYEQATSFLAFLGGCNPNYVSRLDFISKYFEKDLEGDVAIYQMFTSWSNFSKGFLEIVKMSFEEFANVPDKRIFSTVVAAFSINLIGNYKSYMECFNNVVGWEQNTEEFQILKAYLPIIHSLSSKDVDVICSWAQCVGDIETKLTENIKKSNNYKSIISNSSVQNYTIRFDSNCSDVSDYVYTYNTNEGNWYVPTMTRSGYIFCGWFYDNACTQSASGNIVIDSDKTFYAKWQKRNAVITLNSNCSYVPNKTINIDLLYGGNTTIPALSRDGYIFGGWYLDSACTNKASSSLSVKNDITLYAKWHPQFTFTKTNGSITITGIANYVVENGKPDGDISIPRNIDGCAVTKIGDSAFKDNSTITSIILPSSVTAIGHQTFKATANLKRLYWSPNIDSVGANNFEGEISDGLEIYITDLSSWCEIDFGRFYGPFTSNAPNKLYVNGELLTNLVIPTTVSKIGEGCFAGYDYLETLNIPGNVKKLEYAAFEDCKNLKSITIQNGVESIGQLAFGGCTNLQSLVLPEEKELEIGNSAFYHCASLESIDIPSSIKRIGERAFENCHNLKQINLNYGLEEVGEGAFANCFSVENVELPGTLKTLPRDLFIMDRSLCDCDIRHLSSLKNVVLNEGIEEIGYGSFMMCRNLTSISLPDSLKTIGYSAFTYCQSLKTIDLPDSLQTISGQAFSGCKSLEELFIPRNVVTIGPRALMHCDSLSNIDVDRDNIAFMCENGVLYDKEKTRLLRCYDMNDSFFEIPDTVRYIEMCAFQTCKNIDKVVMPDGIDKIADSVFWLCKSLKTIVIPKSVTKIESSALSNTSLEKIYYEGSQRDWNKVTIDASAGVDYCNYFILGTPKYYHCIYSSKQTQICDDGSTITAYIEPSEKYENNKVIFALYKDSKITYVEIKDFTNTQNPLEFSSNKEYDTAKIMIWSNMNCIVPQKPAEIITK